MKITVIKRARITSPALLPPLDPGAALEEPYHKIDLAFKFKNEECKNDTYNGWAILTALADALGTKWSQNTHSLIAVYFTAHIRC
jgi:hypothetical protein